MVPHMESCRKFSLSGLTADLFIQLMTLLGPVGLQWSDTQVGGLVVWAGKAYFLVTTHPPTGQLVLFQVAVSHSK